MSTPHKYIYYTRTRVLYTCAPDDININVKKSFLKSFYLFMPLINYFPYNILFGYSVDLPI